MKHIFHPIVGDTKHGRGEHNKLFRQNFSCHRLLLHAQKISFVHPIIKKPIVIYAGYDTTFKKIFHIFGWDSVK